MPPLETGVVPGPVAQARETLAFFCTRRMLTRESAAAIDPTTPSTTISRATDRMTSGH